MNVIKNKQFDEERALYGVRDTVAVDCTFDGPADGESAFKECSNIGACRCFFNLRYPFWHDHNLKIDASDMTEKCRAALWYSENIRITSTKIHGIKALRECRNANISDCDIISPEFGWSVRGLKMRDCTAEGEYFLMRSEDIDMANVRFSGKYSFQYVKNGVIENCSFNTKDAFWHGENIVIKNCVVKGEYLAWYSNNLVFENCKIIGTQPFCYCKNLRLINCEMIDADLCFEKSQVEAVITTPVISIKNPLSGKIYVPCTGEIIRDDASSKGEVIFTKNGACKNLREA